MKNFPTGFSDAVKTLGPDYDNVTNEAISEMEKRGFVVLLGLTKDLHEQVYRMTTEKHIREYCPRDCTEQRFATAESTAKWLSAGHAFFMLARPVGDGFEVVGYGWSGPKKSEKVPGGETTFAVRLGEAGLGQRLSLPFCRAIIGATAAIYGAEHFWLETWASNAGAVHVYEELGFKKVAETPGHRPSVDGENVEDIRLFMKSF